MFGVEGAWVLAPSRAGAHNWEGTGYHAALASVDALAVLTKTDLCVHAGRYDAVTIYL